MKASDYKVGDIVYFVERECVICARVQFVRHNKKSNQYSLDGWNSYFDGFLLFKTLEEAVANL
jgi:hypothetical protein